MTLTQGVRRANMSQSYTLSQNCALFLLNQVLELMVGERKQGEKTENLGIWFVPYLDFYW